MQRVQGAQQRREQAIRRKFGSALCALALVLCSSVGPVYGADPADRPTDRQVKASYLYNFAKFVRWPASSVGETFDICTVGKTPFESELKSTVTGEQIDGKNIVSRTVTGAPGAWGCKILFISASQETQVKTLLPAAKRLNLLTVSDLPHFAQGGGMIELLNQEGRIRFEVNVQAINEAGLTVSSELLKVAVKVIGANPIQETGR
jgi:YfiR/HmsC-like